jgi:hypothetical protein
LIFREGGVEAARQRALGDAKQQRIFRLVDCTAIAIKDETARMGFQDLGLTPLLRVGTESTERPVSESNVETHSDFSNKEV